MRSLSKLVLGIALGALVSPEFGCSNAQTAPPSGTGGKSSVASGGASGGHSETGGAPANGGSQGSGGTQSTGGTTGAGGAATTIPPGTGGKSGSGGAVTTVPPGTGGGPGTGGSGAGGIGGGAGGGGTITTSDAGPGGGGRPGDAGPAPDVRGSDGRTGSGGTPASGGSTAIGGATGAGGSTGTPGTLRKYFGNIDTNGSIRSDFKTMWDKFSPENAGKWGSVQGGGQSSFNWSSLDTMYKYTQDNNILFKEHCFCWASQQPSFVNSSNATAAVQAWMQAFCDRYPKTAMIDVFNESLHNSPSYKDAICGTGTTGYDWLINAFKWARAACPNAVLLYNDYNTIEYSSENGNVIKLVNAIKSNGGNIDGVGCQGHDVAKVSASTVQTYTQNIITQTGLPVYITEMDIGIADDNKQLTTMQGIVTPMWSNANVKGITYWGYIVGSTWRANTGLMTSSGTKRPALTWLMSFLGR